MIDAIIAVIIVLFILFSFKKGFFMEVFQIFSLLGAYFASKLLYVLPYRTIFKNVQPETVKLFLSHSSVFMGVFIIVLLTFALIRKLITTDTHVKAVDRTMGVVWGTAKALLFVELVLILILKFDILKKDFIADKSIIGRLMIAVSEALQIV